MRSIGRIGAFLLALLLTMSLALTGAAAAKKKHRPKTHVGSQVTVQAVGPDGIDGRVSGVCSSATSNSLLWG